MYIILMIQYLSLFIPVSSTFAYYCYLFPRDGVAENRPGLMPQNGMAFVFMQSMRNGIIKWLCAIESIEMVFFLKCQAVS